MSLCQLLHVIPNINIVHCQKIRLLIKVRLQARAPHFPKNSGNKIISFTVLFLMATEPTLRLNMNFVAYIQHTAVHKIQIKRTHFRTPFLSGLCPLIVNNILFHKYTHFSFLQVSNVLQ